MKTLLLLSALFSIPVRAQTNRVAPPPARPLPVKMVFAHYMVCCPTVGGSATIDDYEREIQEAQKRGIDGFALNCGNWTRFEPHYKKRTEMIYEAARQLGTGFKLFISADGEALNEIPDIIRSFKAHPNQFRYDGKPVLSTFAGEGADNAAGRERTRIAHAEGAVFVPYFYPRPNITETPTAQHAPQLARDFPDIDGYFYFGAAGSGEQIAQSNAVLAKQFLPMGKIFMAGITPYYRGNGGNYRLFETRGFEAMAREWEGAIADGATWVELVTWNDWNESSYLAPFGAPHETMLWKGHFGPMMLSHVAYLDASRYYIDWFKNGAPPPIVRDEIFYFYRLHLKALAATVNANNADKGTARPGGADTLRDEVFVTLFLRDAAQLTIESGDQTQTLSVKAGVSHVAVPFAPGPQKFILRRGGKTVIEKVGEHEISATETQSRFNYFAGSARENLPNDK
jgi:glucan endo-1,3-alpha-glucosidase